MRSAKKQILVVVSPSYDDETRIMSGWAERLVGGLSVGGAGRGHYLNGSEAVRDPLEDLLEALGSENPPECSLLAFFGHGKQDQLIGHDRAPAIDVHNCGVLSGWVVHAYACHSARRLGAECVSKEVECYMGYVDEVWLAWDGDTEECFEGFEHTATRAVTAFADGEVHTTVLSELVRTEYARWIEHWSSRDPIVTGCLQNNNDVFWDASNKR